MKSKSFQTTTIDTSSATGPATTGTNSNRNRSFLTLNDDKINDVIFIEESPKFKYINKSKTIYESKDSFPILSSRNSAELLNSFNNATAEPNKVLNNQSYNDPSLFAIYSNSNGIFKTSSAQNYQKITRQISSKLSSSPNSPQAFNSNKNFQQYHSTLVLNTTKTSNLKYVNNNYISSNVLNSTNSLIRGSKANTSNNDSTTNSKKYLPTGVNNSSIKQTTNNQSPSPNIMSIIKPISSATKTTQSSQHTGGLIISSKQNTSTQQQQVKSSLSDNPSNQQHQQQPQQAIVTNGGLIVSRAKTNLSNYFTQLQQQQQQTATPSKYSSSKRNDLNASFASNTNQPNKSASFNYKYNFGTSSLSSANNSNNRNSNSQHVETDNILSGFSYSTKYQQQQQQLKKSSNDLNESLDVQNRTLLDATLNDDENRLNTSLKYSNKKIQDYKTAATNKQLTKQQTFMSSSNNQQYTDPQQQHKFDESLNFELVNEGSYADDKKLLNRRGTLKDNSKETPTGYNDNTTSSRVINKKNSLLSSSLKRQGSAKSFKSRDPNDSYAYNDVKKYIEENELMPPERAEAIKHWIINVNMYLKDFEQTVI